MNKKVCFMFCALALFVIIVSGCETAGKSAWQAVLRADDWVHRNLW